MSTNKKQSKEFDIIALIKQVFADFKTLLTFFIVFAIIGVIVALNTPKSYTTNVILAPEYGSNSSLPDNLSDIASMVGVDLSSKGGSVDAIYPQIYPDIFTSTDFILTLLDIPVTTKEKGETKAYSLHLIQDTKIPFWNKPKIWLTEKLAKPIKVGVTHTLDPFNLTEGENDIVNTIRSNISCNVDKKTNVITISVKDYDQMVSAIMADTLCHKLQDYIIEYRTKKDVNNLSKAESLYKDAKVKYENIREVYNRFSDANTDVELPSVKSKQEDIENEMQLRYNTFTQAAQQLQAARVKLQEKTPIFTVIQNATIPVKASSTPRSVIVMVYIFVGFVLDAIWVVLLKDFFMKIVLKRKETKEEFSEKKENH